MSSSRQKIRGLREVGPFKVVAFSKPSEAFGWMANTAIGYPVKIDGVLYPTTEQYFQAMKFENVDDPNNAVRMACQRVICDFPLDKISQLRDYVNPEGKYHAQFKEMVSRDLRAGHIAGSIGAMPSEMTIELPQSWDSRDRFKVMERAIKEKLDTHSSLHQQLILLPPETIIVETSTRDSVWADAPKKKDGKITDLVGDNHLGLIFMTERHARSSATTSDPSQKQYADFKVWRKQNLKKTWRGKLYVPSLYEFGWHISASPPPPFFKRWPFVKHALMGVGTMLVMVAIAATVIAVLPYVAGVSVTEAIASLFTKEALYLTTLLGLNVSVSEALIGTMVALAVVATSAAAMMGILVGSVVTSLTRVSQPPNPIQAAVPGSNTAALIGRQGLNLSPATLNALRSSGEGSSFSNADTESRRQSGTPSRRGSEDLGSMSRADEGLAEASEGGGRQRRHSC